MADIINKEKILEHAKKLVTEGKFDRAIVEYEKLMQLDPDDLRVKIKIAELYVKRKQIQDAIRVYIDIASKYSDGGFYLKAVTVYKSILRLNPSLVDVNIALAELYEKMGLVQDALYQYHIIATFYEQKNDQTGVLNIREKMASMDPSNISLQIRLAENYQIIGEVDKSIDMYEKLADQLKEKGTQEQLIELYSKVLSRRPDKKEFVNALCQIFYNRGDLKEIIKRMDAAKSFVATDPNMLAMQAEVYARLNQIETAKHRYRDLAQLLNSQGDIKGALEAYGNMLFLSPEDEEDLSKEIEELGEGAFKDVKARVEERRRKAEEDEKRREDEARRLEEAGAKLEETAKKLGLKPDEISMSHDSSRSMEKNAESNYNLGKMYQQTGLADEAREEFIKALKIYQRLVASGYGSEVIVKRIEELEKYSGAGESTSGVAAFRLRGEQEEKAVEKKAAPKPAARPVVKPLVKKEGQKSEPVASAKKKISFV